MRNEVACIDIVSKSILPGYIIEDEKADLLIIDSYYVSQAYLQSVKELIKTVYLDDVYSFAYDVDCLINYNVYADAEKYKEM